MKITIYFEPRDAWVGLYWNTIGNDLFIYVCLVPFFPIRFILKVGPHDKTS